MDWLERINKVLDYIENNLEQEIDYEKIGQIALCPSNLFQRMFANITLIPLSEYIRRRRLSKAGMELKLGKQKVTELAFKYGYESSDAFSYAFKRLHGVSPSEAKRKDVILKNYPRLSFTFIIKGDEEMNYKMMERETFVVFGKSIYTSLEENMKENSIAKFWEHAFDDGTIEAIQKLAPNKPLLGICYDEKMDGKFHYLIGLETTNHDHSFESITIPSSTWAIFESIGPMPEAIQKVWMRIFNEFLPNSKYDHARTPDFELYYPGDASKNDYLSEVWIPVVLKK